MTQKQKTKDGFLRRFAYNFMASIIICMLVVFILFAPFLLIEALQNIFGHIDTTGTLIIWVLVIVTGISMLLTYFGGD